MKASEIAIKTKTTKQFPPSFVGYIKMKMDLIQNIPEEERYLLRIVDSCYILQEQDILIADGSEKKKEKRNVEVELKVAEARYETMTYDELDKFAQALNVDMSDKTKIVENINGLFRQGLLFITQKECKENKGRYFTKAEDWEIVKG